jgi:hypothetical protein
MAPRTALLANVLGYQCVWFACVGGAAAGRPLLGIAASLAFTLATLALGGRWRADLRTVAIALPLGFVMDSAFAAAGWLAYAAPGPWPSAAPAWIAAIWLAFAMTLNHSLGFLRGHAVAASLLGLAGAPLAYWSASRGFGVLGFAQPVFGVLLAIGAAWALLLPAMLRIAAPSEAREARA